MKKRLLFMLVILSVLVGLFGVAAAPTGKKDETKSVTFMSVDYYHEKGVVFKFKLTGDFKDSELKGSVQVGKKTIKVYCVRKENDSRANAQCVAPSTTTILAGRLGVITFAGSKFSFTVPKRNTEE